MGPEDRVSVLVGMTTEESFAFGDVLAAECIAASDAYYARSLVVDDSSPELVDLLAILDTCEEVLDLFYEDSEVANEERRLLEEADAHEDGECSGLYGSCRKCDAVDRERQEDAARDRAERAYDRSEYLSDY
jgi:hypothetical protein